MVRRHLAGAGGRADASKATGRARVEMDRCIFCGACASVCPVDVIEVSGAGVTVGEGCTLCGLCAIACPLEAISVESPHHT